MLPPLFNPSNDLALAANVPNYIPPRQVQWMEDDLQPITRYWDEGPWGWSPDARRRYLKMGIPAHLLPTDEWLCRHRELSARTTDALYIRELLSARDWAGRLVGHHMRAVHCEADIRDDEQSNPLIYKALWSSSGKGNLPARDGRLLPDDKRRVLREIKQHGGILVDRFYADKAVDFAMEFEVSTEGARFLGYSLFLTAERGRYGGQMVDTQEELLRCIGADRGLLSELVDYHLQHLPSLGYTGPMGIDMMRLTDGRLHPVVELNLRRNMGILALEVARRHPGVTSQELTPRGPHGFQMAVQNGMLRILR